MFDLVLTPEGQAALNQLIDHRIAEHAALRNAEASSSAGPWVTVKEAAEHLRTTPDAVYKRINRGQLVSYRPEGSQILLRRGDLVSTGPPRRAVL